MPKFHYEAPRLTIPILNTQYLRLDTTNDPLTAGLTIVGSADEVQLLIQANAAQNANLQEWQDSGGNVVAGIDERGVLFCDLNTDVSNLFFGPNAGNFTLTGIQNLFIGSGVGAVITTGYQNVGIGGNALPVTTTGFDNIAIGYQAMEDCVDGFRNIAVGKSALGDLTSGSNNVAMGYEALRAVTTGTMCFAFGYRAGYAVTSGPYNMAFGREALAAVTTGSSNSAIGTWAMQQSSGSFNTAINKEAGRYLNAGNYNVMIGYQTARGVTGTSAFANTVIIGSRAAYSITTANNGTIVGFRAGYNLTTGNANILIGYQTGDVLTTGASNIIIGHNIDPSAAGASNEINIGGVYKGDVSTPVFTLPVAGTIGDGGIANYTEFATDGDLIFVGTAGLQFAEIYVEDIDDGIALAAQDTYYQVTSWSTGGAGTDGEANGAVPDVTNDHITITKAGMYLVTWNVSCYSMLTNEYEFEIFTNNGAVGYPNTESYRTTSTAGAIGAVSGSGICDFAASDTVELWVERKDGGAVAKTITVRAVNINITQIGGT